jgi:XTP/dITP diphosphohydrolase
MHKSKPEADATRLESALMSRLQPGTRLVVASHNPGKVREILDLVAPHGLSVVSAGELGLPEPEETGATFAGNARLKALAAAQAAALPALADDSGIEVAALEGRPGIHSARWAGPSKDFLVAMRRVADELRASDAWNRPPGPQANFTAALCLAWPDGETALFEGKVWGHLVWPPRGAKGFGYDPMFVPEGHALTFGEMEPHAKHAISHRARAFALFASACLGDGASAGG